MNKIEKEEKAIMNVTKELIRDVVEWDIKNWWRAIEFWEEKQLFEDFREKKILNIGERNGGLSLYWALKGANVICSDIDAGGFEKAKKLHEKYGVADRIRYEVIDATEIPYRDYFDLISFKSVLGGVGFNDQYDRQIQMIENIYTALNENGTLCFCENLKASNIHQFARKKFTKWGKKWRYLSLQEVTALTEKFSEVEIQTIGLLGVFGRRDWQAQILGTIDQCFERVVKNEWKYIVSCICRK